MKAGDWVAVPYTNRLQKPDWRPAKVSEAGYLFVDVEIKLTPRRTTFEMHRQEDVHAIHWVEKNGRNVWQFDDWESLPFGRER